MKRNAIIKVLSDNNKWENKSLEITYNGTVEQKADCLEIKYSETHLTGMEGTETSILVYENYITLFRVGTIESVMHFERGRNQVSDYSTPYGDFDITTKCYDLQKDINDDGGHIVVDYLIIMQGTTKERMILDINFKVI